LFVCAFVSIHDRQSGAEVTPSKQEIARLADNLNSAEKVTILGGADCAGAHSELIEVAGILQAPIVHGKVGFQSSHPSCLQVDMTRIDREDGGKYAKN
jgi:thiamine pyrophosphate-dependent acetolactate synthase large subunit-like protein